MSFAYNICLSPLPASATLSATLSATKYPLIVVELDQRGLSASRDVQMPPFYAHPTKPTEWPPVDLPSYPNGRARRSFQDVGGGVEEMVMHARSPSDPGLGRRLDALNAFTEPHARPRHIPSSVMPFCSHFYKTPSQPKTCFASSSSWPVGLVRRRGPGGWPHLPSPPKPVPPTLSLPSLVTSILPHCRDVMSRFCLAPSPTASQPPHTPRWPRLLVNVVVFLSLHPPSPLFHPSFISMAPPPTPRSFPRPTELFRPAFYSPTAVVYNRLLRPPPPL